MRPLDIAICNSSSRGADGWVLCPGSVVDGMIMFIISRLNDGHATGSKSLAGPKNYVISDILVWPHWDPALRNCLAEEHSVLLFNNAGVGKLCGSPNDIHGMGSQRNATSWRTSY